MGPGISSLIHVVWLALTLSLLTPFATAAEFRIQANGGYTFSALDEDLFEPLESTSLRVALDDIESGSGFSAGLGVWVDDWLGKNISLGFDYIYTGFEPSTTLRLDILGISRSIDLDADVDLHSFFFNAAWRKHEGRWHPYAGGGIGFGFIDLDYPAPFGGLDGPHAGLQAFIGVDYDISERFYIGGSARSYYIDGRIIGVDLQFLELIVMGNLGVRF